MSRKFITLGWQFTCRAANNPEGCNDPDSSFEDAWQNPDQGRAMLKAAQAHADRTGHEAIVDRHQRVIIEPSAPEAAYECRKCGQSVPRRFATATEDAQAHDEASCTQAVQDRRNDP